MLSRVESGADGMTTDSFVCVCVCYKRKKKKQGMKSIEPIVHFVVVLGPETSAIFFISWYSHLCGDGFGRDALADSDGVRSGDPDRLVDDGLSQNTLRDRGSAFNHGDDSRVGDDLFPESLDAGKELVGIERLSSLRDGRLERRVSFFRHLDGANFEFFDCGFNLGQILRASRLESFNVFRVLVLGVHGVRVRGVRRLHRIRVLHPSLVRVTERLDGRIHRGIRSRERTRRRIDNLLRHRGAIVRQERLNLVQRSLFDETREIGQVSRDSICPRLTQNESRAKSTKKKAHIIYRTYLERGGIPSRLVRPDRETRSRLYEICADARRVPHESELLQIGLILRRSHRRCRLCRFFRLHHRSRRRNLLRFRGRSRCLHRLPRHRVFVHGVVKRLLVRDGDRTVALRRRSVGSSITSFRRSSLVRARVVVCRRRRRRRSVILLRRVTALAVNFLLHLTVHKPGKRRETR